MKEKKNKIAPQPKFFFREAGVVWIEVYGEVMPRQKDGSIADPGFWDDGAEKKHLKLILDALRTRTIKKNIEWTLPEMKKRLRAFLITCWEDQYISKNFMLRIININRTKIFNNQITPKYGQNKQGYSGGRINIESPKPTIKPKGGFGRL